MSETITRESLKMEIDFLPDEALPKINEFILFQKFQMGILNDTDYINSISGLAESILKADDGEWVDESAVKW